MSSYIFQKVHCQCCGKDFKTKLLKGFYNSFPLDLDTYPHNPAIYDRVIICPNCGYATDRVQESIDSSTIDVVNSSAYREVLCSKNISDDVKKELLNAILKNEKGLHYESALSSLRAYWRQRELGIYDEKILEAVIQQLTMYLERTMDIGAAIILIDCQRQQGEFEQAHETATSLYSYVNEQNLKAVVEFELHLISVKDKAPHSQMEVHR